MNEQLVQASNALVSTVGFYAAALDAVTQDAARLLRERNDAMEINTKVLQQQLTLQGWLAEVRRILVDARAAVEYLHGDGNRPDKLDASIIVQRIGAWLEATANHG